MPRKRRIRLNWPLLLASLASVVLLGLLIAWRISIRTSGRSLSESQWQLTVVGASIEAVIATWFLCTGAAIGSYINVVAWRVPRGASLLGPSRCPFCNTELAIQDNLPIFGWLKLGGRCSTCRLPIASRYFWIELFFVAVFGWICFNELLSSGANLPWQPFRRAMSLEHRLSNTNFGIQLFLYVWVVSGLLAIALMTLQRSIIPLRFLLWIAIPCLVIPIIAPSVILVPWQPLPEQPFFHPRFNAMLSPLCGIVFGCTLGVVVEKIWSQLLTQDSGRLNRWSTAGGLAAAGALLGWQAVPVVGLMTCLLALSARLAITCKLVPRLNSTCCNDAVSRSGFSAWFWLAVLVYRSSWIFWYKLGASIPLF